MKRFIQSAILVLFLIQSFALAADRYVPFPVVFVHGTGSSIRTWDTTREALDDFFKGKYGYENVGANDRTDRSTQYFPKMNYEDRNNGDIDDIAVGQSTGTFVSLKDAIDTAISSYTALAGVPPEEAKVNIVAHSLGGLVVRRLLKLESSYADKINRVVFVATPHKGTPLASALWLMNEEQKILTRRLQELASFTQANLQTLGTGVRGRVGALVRLRHNYVNVWAFNNLIFSRLATEIEDFQLFLSSPAIRDQRVAADVASSLTFVGSFTDDSGITFSTSATVSVEYKKADTFLDPTQQNLADLEPSKVRLLLGRHSPEVLVFSQLLRANFVSLATLNGNRTFTGFPQLNSLEALRIRNGDGVVTTDSGAGIFSGGTKILPEAFHTELPKQSQAILGMLDDPPAIERLYVTPVFPEPPDGTQPLWLVVRAADYLMADLKVSRFDIDGTPAGSRPDTVIYQPVGFRFPFGPMEPYHLLRDTFTITRLSTASPVSYERGLVVTGGTLSAPTTAGVLLAPGEFALKLNNAGATGTAIPGQPGVHKFFLKIENAAGVSVSTEVKLGIPPYLRALRLERRDEDILFEKGSAIFKEIYRQSWVSLGSTRTLEENPLRGVMGGVRQPPKIKGFLWDPKGRAMFTARLEFSGFVSQPTFAVGVTTVTVVPLPPFRDPTHRNVGGEVFASTWTFSFSVQASTGREPVQRIGGPFEFAASSASVVRVIAQDELGRPLDASPATLPSFDPQTGKFRLYEQTSRKQDGTGGGADESRRMRVLLRLLPRAHIVSP